MNTELIIDMQIAKVYHPQKTDIGEFVYRIQQPAVAMGKIPGVRVILASIYTPYLKSLCQQSDVVIFHMVSDQDVLYRIEERKRQGLPNVFEISDNFVAFQPKDSMKAYFTDPLNLATVFQYISLSDAVQVSAAELSENFGFLNNRYMVFENQLMNVGDFHKREGRWVTIGWGGSLSHLEDLDWVASAMVDICRAYPKVRFSFMGSEKGFEYFADISEEQRRYTPAGDINDYYRFLEGLDVGLAPLRDTAYNRCRSDVKFLEYASRGVVPVLSAISPYVKNARQGITAFLFRDKKELMNVLSMLVENPDVRRAVAQNAYKYVEAYRLEDLHSLEKVKFYNSLCSRKVEENLPEGVLERIVENSEAYVVKETPAERLSSLGLKQYSSGNVDAEWRFYREAIESMPEYYVPYFLLGDSLYRHGKAESVYYLGHASRVNPSCLRPKLISGLAQLGKDNEAACRRFREALDISDRYAPAWDALARMAEQKGTYGEAEALFNQALQANPFYSLATLGLARTHLAQGREEAAKQVLSIAADILPAHTASRFELAQLFLKVGNVQKAVLLGENILKEDPQNTSTHKFLQKITGGDRLQDSFGTAGYNARK